MKNIFSKLFIFILILLSCKDEVRVVPTIPVDIIVPRDLVLTSNRQTFVVVPDDNGFGILKYGKGELEQIRLASHVYGNGVVLYIPALGEYYAYDLTCTYKAFEDYCAIGIVEEIQNIAECPCCKSKFLLDNGLPITGSEAPYRLKEYNVSMGSSTIRIYN